MQTIAEIPAVCRIDDLVRILQVSRRRIERLRRAKCFPIPEMPSLDSRHPRWSGKAVDAFIQSQQKLSRTRLRLAG